jgi:hypothetical protein
VIADPVLGADVLFVEAAGDRGSDAEPRAA